MKSRSSVSLNLEVLEDRLALSGAFSGAINAGLPNLVPFNAAAINATNVSLPAGFHSSLTGINNQTQNQIQNFQNQLQSLQAAQVAMANQIFSEMQTLLKQFNFNVLFVV